MRFVIFFILYFITYLVVDFTTGFNSDFQYWVSVNGPALGLVVYTLSGLFFGHLVIRKGLHGVLLFVILLVYAIVMEVLVFRNPLMAPQNLAQGLPMLILIYSLILFVPKWIAEGSLWSHKKRAILLIAAWLVIAVFAAVNNPHR